VHAVAGHPDAWRQHVQKRGGRPGQSRESCNPGELQHEHGTVGQRWLPLDRDLDGDRRQKRCLREHELHAEPIAAERAHTRFTNRAPSLEFGRNDLVEQTIGHTDRRLSFTPDQIFEVDLLLLSDQLEYSRAVHAIDRTVVLYGVPNPLNTLAVALRKIILIVEDDHELRRMFRTSLLLEGYDVIEAGDGLDALTRIDREPPDLVVLDLMLPTLSGVAVRQEIAAHVLTREIPVVVVTGSSMNIDHLDVSCVLRKPVAPEELVSAVRRCFQRAAPA
jgi:CheY-like chemotaxis protein